MATSARIVATGRKKVAQKLCDATGNISLPKFVAWGTDGGTSYTLADDNTRLGSECSEPRTSGMVQTETTDTEDDTFRVVGTITASGTRAIKEVGIFDALTGGDLFVRATFAVINLEVGDSIQFTIDNHILPIV